MKTRICIDCGAQLRDTGYDRTGRVCAKCGSARARERRRQMRLALITLFGGECARCGYSRSTRALHFHHKDPTEKHRRRIARGKREKDTDLREVRDHPGRFVLLCANCHAEEHDG
jgi:ribosomal protein L37E